MTSNQSFGIPPEARSPKLSVPYRVSTGMKGPTRSGDKTKVIALDYFLIGRPGETDNLGNMIPLPQFTGQPKEVEIELISDNIADMWRDELACYDGKRKFCGNDQGGRQALRRDKNGAYQPVECDPSTCPLRQNDIVRAPKDGTTAYKEELHSVWAPAYPWAILGRESKCKKQGWFIFKLVDPETKLPLPGEFARYHTQSSSRLDSILNGLIMLWRDTGGRLRGLRCKLIITLTDNGMGGMAPGAAFQPPDAADLPKVLALAARARGLAGVDWDKAMTELAQLSQDELSKIDQDYIYEHFTLAGSPSLPAGDEMLALPAPAERRVIQFATDHPLATALIKKLKVNNADLGKLQQKYQDDVDGLIEYLTAQCEKQQLDITGLLVRRNWTTDAEFVEVKPDIAKVEVTETPSAQQIMDAVAGKTATDEPARGPDGGLL